MRPMSAEISSRPGALAWRLLGALGFVAFGLFALLDASSPLATRAFGIVVVLAAGLFAWLYAREIARPGTRLALDRSGLHLRRRPPETGFDVAWADLCAVRVDRAFDPPTVVVALADSRAGERPPTAAEIRLPGLIGHDPEDVATEIERFRKAYTGLIEP